jgi:hypothetical protein
MAPQSSSGVNEQMLSNEHEELRSAAAMMTGFKFHRMDVAWLWPKGISRWHADTRLATD